jgi:hypothetical protein
MMNGGLKVMFDNSFTNPAIKIQPEVGQWSGTETNSSLATSDRVPIRSCLVGGIVFALALSAQPDVTPVHKYISNNRPTHCTYMEGRPLAPQAGGSRRVSRAEAIRIAKASYNRIEERLRKEVERDAAIPAVWEDG